MTNLLAQSAFLLLAHNRPFEEYHRVLNDFFRLERITRTREKHLADHGGERAARDFFPGSLSELIAEARQISNAVLAPQPSQPNHAEPQPHHPAQPASTPAQNPPPSRPPTLDFELPSFTTPNQTTPKNAKHPTPTNSNSTLPPTLHLPPPLHFPQFSPENPRHLTNLTNPT